MIKDKLTSPALIKRIMKENNLRFTKSLGQNFLTDANIIQKIIDISEVGHDDFVVEVGAGIGGLSQALLERAGSLLAIEIDKRFIPVLENNFGDCPNFSLLEGDALKLDISDFPNRPEKFEAKRRIMVANVPYYITSPLLARFFSDEVGMESITVLVQDELAKRMTAGPGDKDYSALSLMVKLFGQALYALKVPAAVFMPKPKVDSAVVHIKRLDRGLGQEEKKEIDFLIREAFKKRRKMVIKSLAETFHILNQAREKDYKELLRISFDELKLDTKARPENFDLEDFIAIYKKVRDFGK